MFIFRKKPKSLAERYGDSATRSHRIKSIDGNFYPVLNTPDEPAPIGPILSAKHMFSDLPSVEELMPFDGDPPVIIWETEDSLEFFNFPEEISSLRYLMDVRALELNHYVAAVKAQEDQAEGLNFTLLHNYHEQARYYFRKYNVSLLTGVIFGTRRKILTRLLRKFPATLLHEVAKLMISNSPRICMSITDLNLDIDIAKDPANADVLDIMRMLESLNATDTAEVSDDIERFVDNGNIQFDDVPLSEAAWKHFTATNEIDSIRCLMMTPNSYLNTYVLITNEADMDTIGYRLLTEYHRKAVDFNDRYNISLLAATIFRDCDTAISKLLESFTPSELHAAALRKINGISLSSGSNEISDDKYNQLIAMMQRKPEQPVNDIPDVHTDAPVASVEPIKSEPSEFDRVVKHYLDSADDTLSEAAQKYFSQPDIVTYLQANSVYWNAAFLNAYVEHLEHPEQPVDTVLERHLSELDTMIQHANDLAPYSLGSGTIRSMNHAAFEEIIKKFTPEQVNEAALAMTFMDSANKPAKSITPADLKEIVRLMSITTQANDSTVTATGDPGLKPEKINLDNLGAEIEKYLAPAEAPAPKPSGTSNKKKRKK